MALGSFGLTSNTSVLVSRGAGLPCWKLKYVKARLTGQELGPQSLEPSQLTGRGVPGGEQDKRQ